MEIPKEIYVALVVAVGLLIERTYAPLRLASNSKSWPQRATEATVIGIFVIICAFAISRGVYHFVVKQSDILNAVLLKHKEVFPTQYSGTILFSVLLISCSVIFSNLPYKKPENLLKLMRRYGTPIDQLFISSLTDFNMLTLTFKNGWVYIVYVKALPEIGGKENLLEVITVLSGYKGEDNSSLRINENHFEKVRNSIESGSLKQTTVIILDDLMSIEPFDLGDVYNKPMQPTAEAAAD